MELERVSLDHDAQRSVDEIRPTVEAVLFDQDLRLDLQPRHSQGDRPKHGLEGIGGERTRCVHDGKCLGSTARRERPGQPGELIEVDVAVSQR